MIGWASRVYFSDNGSTAIEIALKMALRKFLFDHNIVSDDLMAENVESRLDLKVGNSQCLPSSCTLFYVDWPNVS